MLHMPNPIQLLAALRHPPAAPTLVRSASIVLSVRVFHEGAHGGLRLHWPRCHGAARRAGAVSGLATGACSLAAKVESCSMPWKGAVGCEVPYVIRSSSMLAEVIRELCARTSMEVLNRRSSSRLRSVSSFKYILYNCSVLSTILPTNPVAGWTLRGSGHRSQVQWQDDELHKVQ